ncbi:MAG: hypothetical protein V4616_06770 [Bacteroidota bacterium]
MKTYVLLLVALVLLVCLSFKCEKDDSSCHRYFWMKNKTTDTVYVVSFPATELNLTNARRAVPGEEAATCVEHLGESDPATEFLILAKGNRTYSEGRINHDSITGSDTALARFSFTLEEMRKVGFHSSHH